MKISKELIFQMALAVAFGSGAGACGPHKTSNHNKASAEKKKDAPAEVSKPAIQKPLKYTDRCEGCGKG